MPRDPLALSDLVEDELTKINRDNFGDVGNLNSNGNNNNQFDLDIPGLVVVKEQG